MKPSRTAVLAAAVGYPWVRFATFLMPLRVHYRGDIVLIVDPDLMDPEATRLCNEQRVDLRPIASAGLKCGKIQCPSLVVARFHMIAELCAPYELCLTTDMRDVIFQADPFASLLHPHGHPHDLVLSCEDPTKPIGKSFFNAAWAKKCYGVDFARSVSNKCIVNSGAIFGTPPVFRFLATELTRPCPLTAEVFHGRDQIILNWLEYTGMLANISHTLQPRGEGIVNTMRYVPPPTRSAYRRYTQHARWPAEMPFTIYNEDNRTASAVVHQYEIDRYLEDMHDDAARGWRNRSAGLEALEACRDACCRGCRECAPGSFVTVCSRPHAQPG